MLFFFDSINFEHIQYIWYTFKFQIGWFKRYNILNICKIILPWAVFLIFQISSFRALVSLLAYKWSDMKFCISFGTSKKKVSLKTIRFVNSVCTIFSLWKHFQARADISIQFMKTMFLCRHCLQNEWTLLIIFSKPTSKF